MSENKRRHSGDDYTELGEFTVLSRTKLPKILNLTVSLIVALFIFGINIMVFVPWRQTSSGKGSVIAYSPNERVQSITAFTSGIVNKWYTKDGQFVRKGEPILEVADVDSMRLERIRSKLKSAKDQYDQLTLAANTKVRNRDRQKVLWKKGIVPRKSYEKIEIEYQKINAYRSEIEAKITEMESSLERQKAQIIRAKRDGYVVSEVSTSSYISKGSKVATLIPVVTNYAVELHVQAVDAPLIYPGRKVRLVFEGWPAFQFAAWPKMTIGTFPGVVKVVDSIVSRGMLRVIVVPDSSGGADGSNMSAVWPSKKFLRIGTRVIGWVILNQVSIGYEIWRRMNGFPLEPDNKKGDISGFIRAIGAGSDNVASAEKRGGKSEKKAKRESGKG